MAQVKTPMVSKASYMVPTQTLPHIIVWTGSAHGGYWGRGENAHEACVNAEWIDRNDAVLVCQCDAGAYVDDRGMLRTTDRGTVFAGVVTISGRGKVDIEIKEEAKPVN